MTARDYDALVFDRNATGRFLPLIWEDCTHITSDLDGFGLYTVAGDPRQGPAVNPSQHEAINCLAAVVERTDDEGILQLDCLKTDLFHEEAYQTYLYYNPYNQAKEIRVEVGARPVDLYDAVQHTLVSRRASGKAEGFADSERANQRQAHACRCRAQCHGCSATVSSYTVGKGLTTALANTTILMTMVGLLLLMVKPSSENAKKRKYVHEQPRPCEDARKQIDCV